MSNHSMWKSFLFSPLKIFGHMLLYKLHVSFLFRVQTFTYMKKNYFSAPLTLSIQAGIAILPILSYKPMFSIASRRKLQFAPNHFLQPKLQLNTSIEVFSVYCSFFYFCLMPVAVHFHQHKHSPTFSLPVKQKMI